MKYTIEIIVLFRIFQNLATIARQQFANSNDDLNPGLRATALEKPKTKYDEIFSFLVDKYNLTWH